MGIPQPQQVKHHPLGGEIEHLFTKTLTGDDGFGLLLAGNSKEYLQGLPDKLLNSLVSCRGLEVEIYTPDHTDWVAMYFDRASNSFRLEKMGWLEVTFKGGFNVNDRISCWSLYHPEVGPHGILSFIIEKDWTQVHKENDGVTAKQPEDADIGPEAG